MPFGAVVGSSPFVIPKEKMTNENDDYCVCHMNLRIAKHLGLGMVLSITGTEGALFDGGGG